MIEVGSEAPDFILPDENGNDVRLSDARGSIAILYFYPKDNTPGCTKEACSLRDSIEDLKGLGATVIGISPDSSASHLRFIGKHSLAYGEKMMYGKKTVGVIRTTYIIGRDGKVLRVFRKVNTATHGDDVRKALEELR